MKYTAPDAEIISLYDRSSYSNYRVTSASFTTSPEMPTFSDN